MVTAGDGTLFGDRKIVFPVVCHIKIIAETDESIRGTIERALKGQEVLVPLATGNRSQGGKFVTYNVDVRLHSKPAMDALDASLRAIKGVRVVL